MTFHCGGTDRDEAILDALIALLGVMVSLLTETTFVATVNYRPSVTGFHERYSINSIVQ
jgi:hypothetical protein